MSIILENMPWLLFTGLAITRLIDIVSTYVVTPKLINETNPVVHKFKWPSAWLTLLLCLAPFINIPLGIMILTVSMISSSLNIRKIWMMRAIGEEKYFEIIKDCVRRNGVLKILFFEFASAFLWLMTALFLVLLNDFDPKGYSFWFGVALGAYGLLTVAYYSSYLMRLKKSVMVG